MSVRVVSTDESVDPSAAADYVRVRTFSAPEDDTVTLATIERFVEKAHCEEPTDSTWKVRTLVLEQPMSLDQAMGFATCYAERKHIPLVVADNE